MPADNGKLGFLRMRTKVRDPEATQVGREMKETFWEAYVELECFIEKVVDA